jgi:hypothetical protein
MVAAALFGTIFSLTSLHDAGAGARAGSGQFGPTILARR